MDMNFDRREHVLCAPVAGRSDAMTAPKFEDGLQKAVQETDRYLLPSGGKRTVTLA